MRSCYYNRTNEALFFTWSGRTLAFANVVQWLRTAVNFQPMPFPRVSRMPLSFVSLSSLVAALS